MFVSEAAIVKCCPLEMKDHCDSMVFVKGDLGPVLLIDCC